MFTDVMSTDTLTAVDISSSVVTLVAVVLLIWQFAVGRNVDGTQSPKARALSLVFWLVLAVAVILSGISAYHIWSSILWWAAAVACVVAAFTGRRGQVPA